MHTDLAVQFLDCINEALVPVRRQLDKLAAENVELRAKLKAAEDGAIANAAGAADAILESAGTVEGLRTKLTALEEELARVGQAMPADGKDGRDGKDAEPVTLEDVSLALEGMRGDIMDAARKAAAEQTKAFVDAISEGMETAHETAMAKWALDFERRAQDVLQRAIDRIPPPRDGQDGKDGRDGMGFDDLTAEHDGTGGVTLRMTRGDAVKEYRLQLPCIVDRGVYAGDKTYRSGDAVSYGGSLWIAQNDAPQGKPGAPVSDWRLAVKKGRDGRDGINGKDGARGPQGRDASILDMVRPQP